MKFIVKRMASLILALLIALLAASCGGEPGSISSKTDGETTTAANSDDAATEKLINWESANLPKKDFEGKEFVVLTHDVPNKAHTWYLLAPDEMNGEALNDAMYNRNIKIGEIYNTSISSYYSTAVGTDASKVINSGDDTYAAVLGKIGRAHV